MKKILLTLALVAGASFVQAADTYMYWMLDQTPGVGNPTGATKEEYYARVKIAGTENYLNFVQGVDALYAEASDIPYQTILPGNYAEQSFIIELWNEASLDNPGRASFTQTFAYQDVSKWITTGSQGHFNAGTVHLANFTGAVPEPTSGMMLLVGAMLLGLKRKKLA